MSDSNHNINNVINFTKKYKRITATIIVLLVGMILVGFEYSSFVGKTVYQESVSHLDEVLGQSNKMLNELVNKNMTYLHMCNEYLDRTSNENDIKNFMEKGKEEIGYSNFYFLTSEGKYKTVTGKTGYLGIQGDLDSQINRGNDIVMNAVLPSKPQMLVFVCPEGSGVYQGFKYDAVAFAYDNTDIVKALNISSFDGDAVSYAVHSDGRIAIDNSNDSWDAAYNFIAVLRDHSDMPESKINKIEKNFEKGKSGDTIVTLEGVKFYLVYESTGIQDLMLIGIVPTGVVNSGMRTMQIATIIIVGFLILVIACFIIGFILRRSHISLNEKTGEISCRDELFEKLSMNVDDVFMMLDAKSAKADYVSPNIERLLGITVEQLTDDIRILGDLSPYESLETKSDHLRGLKPDEQRDWEYEFIHQKTGEHMWFHNIAMGSMVNGKMKYILVMSDRTDDRKVNQALSDAVSAAETANRAKSTFLSNMSHDIRTPMNAIIGFTTLAVSNVNDKEKIHDYLEKILSSSNHLLSLINDILDMSRIESGKIHLEENAVKLSDVLHDLRTIVGGQVHAKQLELYMDVMDVTDEDVYCDRTRLNQILLNLLSNAIKFTPAGGTVSVRLKQLPGSQRDRSEYEIRVKDSGIGMSPEFADKIFAPFERERTSTVSRIQGTGLGMAITKNIVDMMGGTIELKTEKDKGSEFIIRIEMRVQPEHRREEKIVELEGLKALVVDDDFNTCDSVTKMLVKVGMRPEWTLSGREAVLRAQQSVEIGDTFHAYIIDWRLPDMNGIEVTRQIRSIGDDTPIIILTAYDWSDIEEEAKAAGVTAFCAKPMFMSDLRKTLMSAIGQKMDDSEYEILPVTDSDFSDKHILLVEDNELNREIALEILGTYGFDVDTAENGAVAVEKVKNSADGQYDLVLMDVQMPVMNGYDATRKIRALDNETLAGVQIVAMTANAFEEDRKKAMDVGMNGFLSKPIVIEELVELLQNNL